MKSAQITRFFDDKTNDVGTLAAVPSLRQAFTELRVAYAASTERPLTAFRGLDSEQYSAPAEYIIVHDRHLPFLKQYTRQQGYYDLLLLDENGAACFSVEKEADFAKIHATDASALGDAWRAVRADGKIFLTDMKLYAPSKNAPAQFVAAPITGTDSSQGVLVLQISLDSINAVMGERSGMGQSGESYLVGEDKRMRSDSSLDPKSYGVVSSFSEASETKRISTMAVTEALAGKSGSKVIAGYRGKKVLSAYSPLKVGNAHWAIMAEIEEREIDERINQALSGSFILILSVSTVAVLLLAFLISALIAKHLQSISRHFAEITEEVFAGRLTARADLSQVGADFKRLLERTNDLIDAFVSRLDNLPVPVLMLDTEHRLRFINSAAAELCGQDRTALIDGECCSIFHCSDSNDSRQNERPYEHCPARRAMSSGITVHGETTLSTQAGMVIPISYTSSPVWHPDGRLLGTWQILIDQSTAKRMAA